MENVNKNAKRALEEFKQEKKNEINMYMESLLGEIKEFLINENNKEQNEFVKGYINNLLRDLEDSKKNALEKYSCMFYVLGALALQNKKPFQDWSNKFENFINDLIK